MRRALLLIVLAIFATHTPSAGDDKDDKRKKEKEEQEKRLAEWDMLLEKEEGSIARKKINEEWKAFLVKADGMELYWLNPRELSKDAKDKKAFHGYEVLATVTLDKDQRRDAGAYFSKTFHWNEMRMALCFNPHHGLHVTAGKKTLDFVICYACNWMKVYDEKELITSAIVKEIEPNMLDAILDKAAKKKNDPPMP